MVSEYMAKKNSAYLKQLQKYVTPGSNKIVFASDQAKNVEEKVFKKELLEEAIKTNMLRTFTMPIIKEMSNISMFPLWKQIVSNIPTKGITK